MTKESVTLENLKRDFTMIYGRHDGPILFPGTGVGKDGEFRKGLCTVPVKDLPAVGHDVAILLKSKRATCSDEDLAIIAGAVPELAQG